MTASSPLDDRHQIIDQLNLLTYLFDQRQWHRIAEVMTPYVDAYGFTGIDDVITNSLRHHLGGCGPSQHLLGNYRITVDGDSAASVTKARVYHQGLGERAGKFFECFGDYHDRWTRTADGWRMIERRFDVSMVLGDFDVLQPG